MQRIPDCRQFAVFSTGRNSAIKGADGAVLEREKTGLCKVVGWWDGRLCGTAGSAKCGWMGAGEDGAEGGCWAWMLGLSDPWMGCCLRVCCFGDRLGRCGLFKRFESWLMEVA